MENRIKYNTIHIRDYYPSEENPASSPWVYDQVKALQQFNINSLVISPTPFLPNFLRSKNNYYLYPKADETIKNYEGTDVVRPKFFKIPKNKLLSLNFKNLSKSILRAATKAESFSLIHAHFGQNGIATLKLKEKYNVPLITSFYGYDSGRLGHLYAPFYKKLARQGELFLALSEDMKSDLLNLGFPSDKIKIHHLGINLNQFNPFTSNTKDHFVFLVVARLDESKGVHDVIKAFGMIHNPDMQLRIVGDGVHKNALFDLVSELKINNNVEFINNFKMTNPRQTVLKEMQNCDVALLTSYIAENGAKEGTPVVLMEAQSCSKPCIATYHAGIPEVVIDNQTGYLVKERDVDSIAEKMNLFYENRNLVNEMGANARNHIANNFNQKVQINKLYSIYKNLTNYI